MATREPKRQMLSRAPIAEAIIDFRFQKPLPIGSDVFAKFREFVEPDYPEIKEKRQLETNIDFSAKDAPKVLTSTHQVQGYVYSKTPASQIIQLEQNGITFNKLKPYDRWETFSAEAKRLLGQLHLLVPDLRVSRIGIRYINRLELPLPFKSFDEFLNTSAHLPGKFPFGMSEYLIRLVVPNTEAECMAVIHQQTLPTAHNALPLIFDIDVFKMINASPSDRGFWGIAQTLKDFENTIFFESITEKTEKLYK